MRKHFFLFLACLLSPFLLWEWVARTFPHFLFILPPPTAVLRILWEMRDRFLVHTLATCREMIWGFFIAALCSFPLAWVMSRCKMSRTLLQPLFVLIQCVPMFTLAPIMVIWFGWGQTAIIIPTALMIFFPLTLNIYQGFLSTPLEWLEFFQSNQATAWQTFYKLRLPCATPHIFAGLKISGAIAGASAVAGEWAGAQQGLGVLMLESRRNIDLEITFGALFCLTCISMVFYGLILYTEKIILPPRKWRLFPRAAPTTKKIWRKRKQLAFPALLLSSLWLLTGCTTSSTHKISSTVQHAQLLLDWLPNPNHIPLYVGVDRGFFQQEGIDLSIDKMLEGGGGISYLVAHKADLLIGHMPGALKAYDRGAAIKIIGVLIKEPLSGLISRSDLSIRSVADLTGKVLGYCVGEKDTIFLDFLLQTAQISPKERKNVSVDLVSAIGTGHVDFIYGGFWNIEPCQLKALGVETQTYKLQHLGVPLYYEMIILANADTPYTQPDFVERFQRALQRAINFCTTYPDEAFACFLRYTPDKSPKTIAWQQEAWKITYPLLAETQTIETSVIETFHRWQRECGITKREIQGHELLTSHESYPAASPP